MTNAALVRNRWKTERLKFIREGVTRALSWPFIRLFLITALPITLQAIMASSRTVFDVLMTSSLGAQEVAVVGYGSRIVFILVLLVLGICNGAGVVIAQFFGGGYKERAKNAIGTIIYLSCTISLIGLGLVLFAAEPLAHWSGNDLDMQQLTLDYLIPASFMVIPLSISFSIAVGLRSVGKPGLATSASIIGLVSSVVLNYALIFGNMGAPELGIKGAAYASVASFIIEVVINILCAIFFYDHQLFALKRLGSFFNVDTIQKILTVGLPIAFGSAIWAIGIFVYSVITAQSGSDSLAVLALVTPVESMAIAVMIGFSSTTNVLVGQRLGHADFHGATIEVIGLVFWTVVTAIIMGITLFLLKPVLLLIYAGTGTDVLRIADQVFDILALVIIFRALNVTMIVGALRAGADTKYPVIMDILSQWLVAIPLSCLFVFHLALPYPWVFLAVNSEEIAKQFMAYHRLTRFHWLRQIKPEI